MRVVEAPGYEETRDAISHDWIRLVARLGWVPVLVPNSLDHPAEYLEQQNVEALILSGGNDLYVQSGSHDPAPSDVAPDRDRTERLLLDYAIEKRISVFGVCRGMQFLNVHFNGGLQRIESGTNGSNRHVASTHTVRIVKDRYAALMGESLEVNSFHEYGVRQEDVSPQLSIFAVEKQDNLCEGIYHPHLPIVGIQWHPERSNPAHVQDERLMKAFLENKV